MNRFGKFVDMAEETKSLSRVDAAWVWVFILCPQSVKTKVTVKINGLLCNVRLMEENILLYLKVDAIVGWNLKE